MENENINNTKSTPNECIIYLCCPFTNIVLLFYYIMGITVLYTEKNTCSDENIWLYNLLSYLMIFVTNCYFINEIFLVNNNNSNVNRSIIMMVIQIIIYFTYVSFIVWGIFILLSLGDCNGNNVLINMMSYLNIFIQSIVFILINVFYLCIIYLFKKSRIIPITNTNTREIIEI